MRSPSIHASTLHLAALAVLSATHLTIARAQSPAITLTPAVIQAGSPALIRVEASGNASVDGEWLDHKLQFFLAAQDTVGTLWLESTWKPRQARRD